MWESIITRQDELKGLEAKDYSRQANVRIFQWLLLLLYKMVVFQYVVNGLDSSGFFKYPQTLSTNTMCHVMLSLWNNFTFSQKTTQNFKQVIGVILFSLSPGCAAQCLSSHIHLTPPHLIPNPQNNNLRVVEIIKLTPKSQNSSAS